jgi:hypothetical protein
MCAPPPAGNVEAVVALFDALFLEAAMPSPFRADGAGGADVRKPYSTCRTLSESIPEHRSERICGRAAVFARRAKRQAPMPHGRRAEGAAGLDGAGADRAIMNVTTMRVVCPRDQVPRFYS